VSSNSGVCGNQECLSYFGSIKLFSELMLHLGTDAIGRHLPVVSWHMNESRETGYARAYVMKYGRGHGQTELVKQLHEARCTFCPRREVGCGR
jgi:hypothetical protein